MSAATRAAYTTYALTALAVATAAVMLIAEGGTFLGAVGVAAALVAPVAVIAFGVFTFLTQGRGGGAAARTRNAVGSAAAVLIAVSAFWVSVIAAVSIGFASFVARIVNSVTDALGLSPAINTGGASAVAGVGMALALIAAVGAVASAAAAVAASADDQ